MCLKSPCTSISASSAVQVQGLCRQIFLKVPFDHAFDYVISLNCVFKPSFLSTGSSCSCLGRNAIAIHFIKVTKILMIIIMKITTKIMSTRSGPEIPVAGQLEGGDFLGSMA